MPWRECASWDLSGARNLFRSIVDNPACCGINSAVRIIRAIAAENSKLRTWRAWREFSRTCDCFSIPFVKIYVEMSLFGPGRINLGGLAGASIGATGGLFALGIVPAIAMRDPQLVINTPILNALWWILSLPIGWGIGSFVGSFLGRKFHSDRAELVGGAIGGVLTNLLGCLIGWWAWQGAPA